MTLCIPQPFLHSLASLPLHEVMEPVLANEMLHMSLPAHVWSFSLLTPRQPRRLCCTCISTKR
jgi:hypothetical protein